MSRPPPLRCKRHLVVRATAAAALAVILLSPSIKKTLMAGKLDRMDSVRTGNRRRLPFVNTWLTLRGGRRPSMYPSLIMDDEIETGDEGMEKAQMELLERSMPYPASIREQSSWVKRDKNLKYKAFTDALLFDGRTDLLPKPLPYNDKAFNEDSDPYEDEYDPPAPGLWQNAGKNKTYWGMTTRQFKDLEDYVQDIRDPKCQPDWLPLEGYHEAKRKLITAIQHQDQRELKEAIEFGIRFGGLMGYIMQAEVLIAQLRERERYERYKVRKGFLKEKTMTIHINDRRSLILAKEKRCKELTIVSPEPQYQIVNISGGEPDYGAWLELDGCERKADGRYQVLLANDTVNRQMNMASMRLVDVRPEYIRKKQVALFPELTDIYTLKRLKIKTKGILTGLPKDIGRLSKLKELDVSDNALTDLPESIVECSDLRILDISQNKIEELPSELHQLEKLTMFHAADNRLRSINELIGCKDLQYLNVDHNAIGPDLFFEPEPRDNSLLPRSFPNLEVLSAADNKVEELPRSLDMFESLTHLNVSSNMLAKLPRSLARLDANRMKEIYVQGNRLQDQARIDRILSMDKPIPPPHPAEGCYVLVRDSLYQEIDQRVVASGRGVRGLIWYLQQKAKKRLKESRAKYLYSFAEDELKAMIDRIALTEDLDIIRDDETRVRLLHIACARNEHKLVEALLTQGADPEAQDRLGNTPLHYAMGYGHLDCTKILVDSAEVDTGALNKFNKTAEQVARSRETDFLVSAESEEAPMKEPEPLMDGKGHVISGLPCGVETSLRVCLGRLFGVPPIPLAKPSVTERMINVSHTKMAPDPITRPAPVSILEVEDPATGPLWEWVCEQIFHLLVIEVEEFPPLTVWIKNRLRRLQELLREENLEQIYKEQTLSTEDLSDGEDHGPTPFELLLHNGLREDAIDDEHWSQPTATGVMT